MKLNRMNASHYSPTLNSHFLVHLCYTDSPLSRPQLCSPVFTGWHVQHCSCRYFTAAENFRSAAGASVASPGCRGADGYWHK